jgi:hypothetical protein
MLWSGCNQEFTMSDEHHVLAGGCLCSAVRYSYAGRLGGALGAITVCHCGQCRKAQGYASAVAPALAKGFQIVRGAALIRDYESSPGKKRAFCSVCGSPLYSKRDADPSALRLRLGSLDAAPPALTVEAHIFTAGAPTWAGPDAAPRFAGLEPGRA